MSEEKTEEDHRCSLKGVETYSVNTTHSCRQERSKRKSGDKSLSCKCRNRNVRLFMVTLIEHKNNEKMRKKQQEEMDEERVQR